MNKLKIDDFGVSAVLGVVLMVAVTVILSAVVILLIGNISETKNTEITTIGIMKNNDEYIITNTPNEDLTYGDIIYVGCATVRRGDTVLTEVDTLSPGDVFSDCDSPLTISYDNKLIYTDN